MNLAVGNGDIPRLVAVRFVTPRFQTVNPVAVDPYRGKLVTSLQAHDLETESQAEVGFLSGPYSQQDVSELVGSEQWSLSKRFALYQGEERKIRIIDNYRDSGVNAAFSSTSYLALHDTDFVIGFPKFFMWVAGDSTEVVVPMSDGTVLRGRWHKSLGSKPMLLGRCVDLSKAYKQVAVATESLKHGVLGYRTENGDWQLLRPSRYPLEPVLQFLHSTRYQGPFGICWYTVCTFSLASSMTTSLALKSSL